MSGSEILDNGLFEEIYDKNFKKVYNYFFFRFDFDLHTAEDLAQQTFLKAYEALPSYEDRGYSYLTYLINIAHNLAVSHVRKQPTESIEEAEAILDPNESEETHQNRLAVQEVLSVLSPAEKDAIVMHYYDDLSVKEIAEIMKRTENAVKLLLSRGRQKMGMELPE